MNQKQQLIRLAKDYIHCSEGFIAGQIKTHNYRKIVNQLALIERSIPYDMPYRRYIAGEDCFHLLLNEILVNQEDSFVVKINTILPNRGMLSNQYIQGFVYDLISKKCRINANKIKKIHIHMEQYIAPCKNGKLNKDSDNNEKKGVIDGIVAGLGIDDTGDRISYSSTIKPLPKSEEPYTLIYIVPDESVEKFFNSFIEGGER